MRCPTLSPIATCCDRELKCGKKTFYCEEAYQITIMWQISLNFGDSKDFVATKVANVATRNILVSQH
jgi:hypothetical protein